MGWVLIPGQDDYGLFPWETNIYVFVIMDYWRIGMNIGIHVYCVYM